MKKSPDKPGQPVQAVIIVDHGSRRAASNQMLHRAAELFADRGEFRIVEPAHMELAAPDMAMAFQRCVARGAEQIIVFPYFLSPGRHWDQDIPRLVADAAVKFPHVSWLVTAPFGLHPQMTEVISDRIRHCLANASLNDGIPHQRCDVCLEDAPCQFHSACSGPG